MSEYTHRNQAPELFDPDDALSAKAIGERFIADFTRPDELKQLIFDLMAEAIGEGIIADLVAETD